MNIIFLNHHEYFQGYSMKRYGAFLHDGMKSRGHDTDIWFAKSYISKYNSPESFKKWLRYIDQFLIFPFWFKRKKKTVPSDTLFVLIDQALGMLMPLLRNEKHVVHCHDFIALKSAKGLIKENPTSWTGKLYQNLIFKGFSQANSFISISKNTQNELVDILKKTPKINAQVYNALNPIFKPGSIDAARTAIGDYLGITFETGYLLHVGGNDFYKNRVGVIALYNAWRNQSQVQLPLLLIGYEPSAKIQAQFEKSSYKDDIHFMIRVEEEILLKAYQGASVFVFPSLAEGFGWPVAEAMASGCPVITTNEAPMNEVGGDAAFYINRQNTNEDIQTWAENSARNVEKVIQLDTQERDNVVRKGYKHIERFNENKILNELESVYTQIIKNT